MNIGRRMFAALLPAAPAAAATGFQHVLKEPLRNAKVYRTPPDVLLAVDPAQIPRPAGLDLFYKANQDAHKLRAYMNLLAESRREVSQNGMPPSIDCLRSVSRVHKHYMMVNRLLKRQEEERTFTEKLMDRFGVRKWFEDQHGRGGDSESRGSSGF